MATLGTFGDIVFEVSAERMRSFADFSHEGGARLESTEIVGREPLVTFAGPGGQSVSFVMGLNSAAGVVPQQEYERLQQMKDAGLAAVLVLGGRPYGGATTRWIIEGLSASYRTWTGDGRATGIDVTVSLRKYVQIEAAK